MDLDSLARIGMIIARVAWCESVTRFALIETAGRRRDRTSIEHRDLTPERECCHPIL